MARIQKAISGLALAALTALTPLTSFAVDLGIEGQVYEVIEEDFRLMLMRMVARTDWEPSKEELKQSVEEYTKNLPSYYLPRAEKTLTRWKDVGIVTTQDITMPVVDFENGSVFEPEMKKVLDAKTYLNPIAQLPAEGIDRLYLFDATDPEQLEQAKALMRLNIPLLNFMTIAGDLGPISEEMNMPLFHPTPTMLEKFHIRAVPTLIGFGRGEHQGHMAITEFAMPVNVENIRSAWFGQGDAGPPPSFIETPERARLSEAFRGLTNERPE